ncbi:MAG: glycosyltransferase [Alphaproteobacteria bacterium]|nr:glycosyltransferase [Alphaproteobacteria bacterium]
MKIMQVMAGAEFGGAETAFEDMCLAMAERQKNLCAVIRPNNPERIAKLEQAGIKVFTLPFGGALDFYTPWKLKKIIAQECPQIVQTWMSRASIKTPASKPSKSYLKLSRLGGYYGLKYFRTTDYFVTITQDIRQHLIKNGIESTCVRHINNFAETEQNPEPVLRSDLNTPNDAFVALTLSRYHPVKALDVLIKAAEPIKNCHLWLAGEGPMEGELKKLAKDLNMTDRVHFLGWRTDRAALLQAADVCVFPSRYEPFGTTFVQAWAQKTPLVCSTAKGPVQYVRNQEDALVFEIDDVEQLTAALKKLESQPEIGKQLAQAGFIRFENEFSKEKTVEAYLEFYRDVLNREHISDV